MGEVRLHNEELLYSSITLNEADCIDKLSSVNDKIGKEFSCEECPRTSGNWTEALSSLSNVNAKLAWKNGAERLSQTLNNVKTTFGVLSQRIKKSTRRRKPLINTDSPGSPVTPYTRSKASLGRTPTKLYSPFHIDTPVGKENSLSRISKTNYYSDSASTNGGTKKPKRTRLNLDTRDGKNQPGGSLLENEMLETQIGIYEFQSVANRILQNRPLN